MTYLCQKEDRSFARRLLEPYRRTNKKLIFCSPFTRWSSKSWGVDKVEDLSKALEQQAILIVSGTNVGSAIEERLVCLSVRGAILNTVQTLSIGKLAAVMEGCDGVITCDSFTLHVAMALGKKTIALFGPTMETKVGPLQEDPSKVHPLCQVMRPSGCRVCYRRRCRRFCMEKLDATSVAAASICFF